MGLNYKSAKKILPQIKAAAVDAGIYHAWFLAFGCVLGACREYQKTNKRLLPIPHDDDLDIGIQSWKTTKEQEEKYYHNLDDAGLFKERRRVQRRPDTNRFLWFSLRKKRGDCKCCNWFMWKWNNFVWHGKGHLWVNHAKFSKRRFGWKGTEECLAKGIPATLLEELAEIDYEGETYNVPLLSGACCDAWYPGWYTPRKGGASKKDYVLLMPKFSEPNRWRMV